MLSRQEEKDHIIQFIRDHKLPVKHYYGLKNFTGNIVVKDALVLIFSDEKSLSIILKEIDTLNSKKDPAQRILAKAASGGRLDEDGKPVKYSNSFSLAPVVTSQENPIDIVLCPCEGQFREIKILGELLDIGSGVQIQDISEKGSKENSRLLASPSLIKYPGGIGLLSTAGHGTGILNKNPKNGELVEGQPSLAGAAAAFRICLFNGDIVRIRHPKRKAKALPGDLDISAEDFEAMAANLGLFGVIIGAELDSIEADHKLHSQTSWCSVPQLKEDPRKLFLDSDYPSVFVFPPGLEKKFGSEDKKVLSYKINRTSLDTPDSHDHVKISDAIQKIEIEMEEKFKISQILAVHEDLVPAYNSYALRSITKFNAKSEQIGPWNDIYHYQVEFPHGIELNDFQFETSQDLSQITKAIQIIEEEWDNSIKNGEWPLNLPIYIRLFGGTNGGLSTSRHKPGNLVCAIDITSQVPYLKGYPDFIARVVSRFTKELDALFHLGKSLPKGIVNTDPNYKNDDWKRGVDYSQLLGQGFHDFKRVFNWWHAQNKLALERNIFLTHEFCDVLQVPELSPAPRLKVVEEKVSHSHSSHFQPPSLKAQIQKDIEGLLTYLEYDEEKETIEFKNALKSKLDKPRSYLYDPKKCVMQ